MICTALAITLSLASVHLTHNYNDDYNEINPGITIECDQYSVGVFKNSYNKDSVHAGLIFKHGTDIIIGTNVGVVSGYQSNVVPFVRPFIQYNGVRVGYIPAAPQFKSESTITLEYSITFN